MPMIPTAAANQIKEFFDRELEGEVKVAYFTQPKARLYVPGRQDCQYCGETQQLLEQVSALSDKITLEVHDVSSEPELAESLGIERVPAFELRGAARGKVRYFGIPSGHEFPSLIETIATVSSGTTDLSEETRAQLRALESDVHVLVFFTPT